MHSTRHTENIEDRPDVNLAAEANHRVANSLALLGGLVRMQARAIGKSSQSYTNAEIRLLFDGIAARIATIGQLHRMLAAMPSEGIVALNSHLRDVCHILVTAFSSEEQSVHIIHQGSECHALVQHVQSLTLILCEIITNAMKYAHPAGAPLHITVTCDSGPEGTLHIGVRDDGIGLPEGFDPATDGGIGFQVMRALATEIGAALDIRSGDLGVDCHITLPQALVANEKTA